MLFRSGDQLAPYARQGRLVVVTDAHVAAAQLPRLEASLRAADVAIEPIILPPGEQTKSWPHLEQLLDALLALEIERGDHIVALGGGVIGDGGVGSAATADAAGIPPSTARGGNAPRESGVALHLGGNLGQPLPVPRAKRLVPTRPTRSLGAHARSAATR